LNTNSENTIFIIQAETCENLNISGNGRKAVLCVTDEEGFGESRKTLLTKMLSAVGLDPGQDVWIALIANGQTINPALLAMHYSQMIVFGLPPESVSLNINHHNYKVIRLDQARVLFCDSLAILETSQDKKKLLWESLKSMFDIK
jgi:hypothetical protein